MSRRHLRLRATDGAALRAGFAAIRADLGLPQDFPPDVLVEAAAAAEIVEPPDDDLTALPFLTVDPPGSMDLDQAMHLERRGGGYRVRYAIADVAAFVRPGGAIDAEAHRRGETLYSPDTRTPLHPPSLSEDAASLLPGQVRPALLWTLDLDADGAQQAVDVRRALVRSRDRLHYAQVQQAVDHGVADERLRLLAEVGALRKRLEVARGGVSLPIADQEVVGDGDSFRLEYRLALPSESWNEQISLMTGMAAAGLMLDAGIGVLRTLPPAPDGAIRTLRRAAAALGVDWPEQSSYAEVIRGLDPANPRHAALVEAATVLLRGAGYTAFDGAPPALTTHAAVAAPYAHATAPLRRLVDRYVGAVCLAVCAGREVPDWARAGLPAVPATMAECDRRAGELERQCVALMEAVALRDEVGASFAGVVVDVHEKGGGTVVLDEPAVRAPCDGQLPLGERVQVRLVEADPGRRTVRFALA